MNQSKLADYSRFPRIFGLMRHGETEANRSRIIQGWQNSELTQDGKTSVEKTAIQLVERNIDAVYSSDLKRTRDTADIITQYINVPIQYDKGLREQNFGIYEGQVITKLIRDMRASGQKLDYFTPESGESGIDFRQRIMKSVAAILQDNSCSFPLIITHGGVIRVLLKELLNNRIDEEIYKTSLGNNAVTVLHNDQGKLSLEYIVKPEYLNEDLDALLTGHK